MEILVKSESCSLSEAALKLKKLLASLSTNSSFSKDRPITRLEVKVNKENILAWLKQQSQGPKIYWSNREGTTETGGVGAADCVVCANAKEISLGLHKINQTLKDAAQSLKYFGGMCFDANNLNNEWSEFGPFWFVLPRFELVHQKKESFLACNLIRNNIQPFIGLFPSNDTKEDQYLDDCSLGRTLFRGTIVNNVDAIMKELDLLDFEISSSSFDVAHYQTRIDHPNKEEWLTKSVQSLKAIKEGVLKKVVLAKKTQFHFNDPIDPWDLVSQLKNDKSDCYHYCFSPNPSVAFLGASPERLYERKNREIKTEAIAGTRPRGTSTVEDERFKNELLTSPKELREHQLVVDFIEERLSSLCSELKWNKRASLLRLKEGQHLYSACEGLLKANVSDEELIFKLHPTPAVSGVPQEKALKAIWETEPFSRGWYAGPIGWIANEEAEFAVAIRCGLLQGSKLSLFSGAGLVEGSTPESEWEEIEHKLGVFLKILKT